MVGGYKVELRIRAGRLDGTPKRYHKTILYGDKPPDLSSLESIAIELSATYLPDPNTGNVSMRFSLYGSRGRKIYLESETDLRVTSSGDFVFHKNKLL